MLADEAAAAEPIAPATRRELAAFRLTPDLRFAFAQPARETLLADVLEALRSGGRLIVTTGDTGMGKTLLLLRLQSELQRSGALAAYVPYPELGLTALLTCFCAEFGLSLPAQGADLRIAAIAGAFNAAGTAGRRIILMDDADRCPIALLSDLHELVSALGATPHALQIVLAGAPTLAARLLRDLPHMHAAAMHRRLPPFEGAEIEAYVRHRLRVAGAAEDTFSSAAMAAIGRYSRGIPRLINQVCSRALLLAGAERSGPVSEKMVEEAIRDCPANGFSGFRPAEFVAHDTLGESSTGEPHIPDPVPAASVPEPEASSESAAAPTQESRPIAPETPLPRPDNPGQRPVLSPEQPQFSSGSRAETAEGAKTIPIGPHRRSRPARRPGPERLRQVQMAARVEPGILAASGGKAAPFSGFVPRHRPLQRAAEAAAPHRANPPEPRIRRRRGFLLTVIASACMVLLLATLCGRDGCGMAPLAAAHEGIAEAAESGIAVLRRAISAVFGDSRSPL